jgi:hypothetical protein
VGGEFLWLGTDGRSLQPRYRRRREDAVRLRRLERKDFCRRGRNLISMVGPTS